MHNASAGITVCTVHTKPIVIQEKLPINKQIQYISGRATEDGITSMDEDMQYGMYTEQNIRILTQRDSMTKF